MFPFDTIGLRWKDLFIALSADILQIKYFHFPYNKFLHLETFREKDEQLYSAGHHRLGGLWDGVEGHAQNKQEFGGHQEV